MREQLRRAWEWREQRGILQDLAAVRVFHGPGEGIGPLSQIAIDRFGSHFWLTQWAGEGATMGSILPVIAQHLEQRGAHSAVMLLRPERGISDEPRILFGSPPIGRFEVDEEGARYKVQLLGVRHPGLFLDHLPLRQWLRKQMRGLRVLNTFSYTGSLSVAAALAGAAHVTTLDLSNPILAWAGENWALNGLSQDRGRWISGDYFEWLPRLKREGERFDCIILDPPSFSRGKKGIFSTAKDLGRLHGLAMEVLAPGGYLVSSINSANVSAEKFESEIFAVAKEKRLHFKILKKIDLPETFPTPLGDQEARYLKGLILCLAYPLAKGPQS